MRSRLRIKFVQIPQNDTHLVPGRSFLRTRRPQKFGRNQADRFDIVVGQRSSETRWIPLDSQHFSTPNRVLSRSRQCQTVRYLILEAR